MMPKLRHEMGAKIFGAWGERSLPAMGMIGTLAGLVIMLGNMSDPKAIGPAMAVALICDDDVRRDPCQRHLPAHRAQLENASALGVCQQRSW